MWKIMRPASQPSRQSPDRSVYTLASFLRDDRSAESGQSLVEVALTLPLLVLLVAYAVDMSYCFIVAANITSAARNGTQYSVMGYQAPAQSSLAPAGPSTTTNSVAAATFADLTSLINSSTTSSIQVCSKTLGMSGNIPKCNTYGQTGTAQTPGTDPEAPTFVLQRVDVTYTVQPPIPLSIFKASLLPGTTFHRQVSMRVMD
jgi:hypothetical protein